MRLTFEIPDDEVERVLRDLGLMLVQRIEAAALTQGADTEITRNAAVDLSGLGESTFKRYAANGRIPRVRRGPRSFTYFELPILEAKRAGFPKPQADRTGPATKGRRVRRVVVEGCR